MLENPMYLADPSEPEPFVEQEYDKAKYERSVDLKWSLWLRNKDEWEEYAPGVWDWMREWFEAGTGDGNPESAGLTDYPRIVHTAPRKEIRFGSVEFQPGVAYVHFWAEWDNGRTFNVGSEWQKEAIEAETFEQVMHLIDHREVDLMREEHQAYHGRKGEKLQNIRCHECGYPYRSPKSRVKLS